MSEPLVETINPSVTITPAAIERVKFLIKKQGNDKLGLRLGVKGGGCSGLSYVMNLEENATARDHVFETDGVRVMVDRKSATFLDGLVLDYTIKNLLEGGWKWTNPNAAKSCGCGTSFTPKS